MYEVTNRSMRRDPTTGEWTVIAPERAARPLVVPARGLPDVPPEACPFCPGHEAATGHAIAEVRDMDRWVTRVVPNRYPALDLAEPLRSWGNGPYDAMGALGAHEVIIESPEHAPQLYAQAPQRMRTALRVVRDRLRDLSGDRRFAQLAWFRNVGLDAGGSQAHPHAQVVALPVVPERAERMLARADAHLRARGRSLFADIVDQERRDEDRLVVDRTDIVAFCPWAPQADAEVWIVPDRPQPRFREADDALVDSVADLLRDLYAALEAILGTPSSTLTLHTAPQQGPTAGFRWHLRLMPRRVPRGGLEIGSGSGLVGLPPEEAAALIREHLRG